MPPRPGGAEAVTRPRLLESLESKWPGPWASPVLIAAAFVALTVWSWRKWPDVLVDFGQQLYIPWRLVSGEHLYKDILLLFGPLSQHVNALLFWVFGTSFTVLIVANLAVLAGITAVMYRVFRLASDRLTATTACLLFLVVFGFSQYTGVGNFNYVAPYTHEATHGILLTTGLVLLLSRYISSRDRGVCLAAGCCFGLALQTRIDVAVAATAVTGAGLAAAWLTDGDRRPRTIMDFTLFGVVAAAPLVVFFAYFLSYLPAGAALAATAHGFAIVSSSVANNRFFRGVMGTDDIIGNATKMCTTFAWIAAGVLGAALVDAAVSRLSRRPHRVGLVLGFALFGGLVLNLDALPWSSFARALPLTSGAALTAFGWLLLRARQDPAERSAIAPMCLWSMLSLALLLKMILNARISNYGFYLAMPSTVLLAVCLVWWIPQALRASFGSGTVFRSLALAVLVALGIYQLLVSEESFYRVKTLAVGRGGDTMLTFGSPRVATIGSRVNEALEWIDTNMPANATFAGFPEGITLNYLARRPTTLPVVNFMMTEELVFGEEIVLASLEHRPPDYVLLVHKDTSEFGYWTFGDDPYYGQRIMTWINRHYEPVALIGAEPFAGSAFGIKILKRRLEPN
jgi:hypothetical protein